MLRQTDMLVFCWTLLLPFSLLGCHAGRAIFQGTAFALLSWTSPLAKRENWSISAECRAESNVRMNIQYNPFPLILKYIKHPLGNHGLVGKFHIPLGPFMGCLILGWWDYVYIYIYKWYHYCFYIVFVYRYYFIYSNHLEAEADQFFWPPNFCPLTNHGSLGGGTTKRKILLTCLSCTLLEVKDVYIL